MSFGGTTASAQAQGDARAAAATRGGGTAGSAPAQGDVRAAAATRGGGTAGSAPAQGDVRAAAPAPSAPVGPAAEPPTTFSADSDEAEESPAPVRGGKDDPTRRLQDRWRAAVETVRAASARHGASLAHGRILWIRPGDVGVAYTKAAEFHRTMVSTSGRTIVENALADHFGRPTKLTLESTDVADAASPSIAEEEAAHRQQRERGADQKIRTHPAVLATLKILGGEIEHIQVLEPERPAQVAAAVEPELDN